MRVLVLGASGMLGNAIFKVMAERADLEVFGTVRICNVALQNAVPTAKLIHGINADQTDSLARAFAYSRPEAVINCVGLVKQLVTAKDPLEAIPINSLLPHRLARLCEVSGARLIHFSTDCVFSGVKGHYLETDVPDAGDVYGRTKLLGEVDYPYAITLRTSIIGHELASTHGLVEWFLDQQGSIKGYTKSIFSGLPTCELARVVCEYVLPKSSIHGVYHVAGNPISKYELLQLVNREYKKGLIIEPDDKFKINRSLDATRFKNATGYVAPEWPVLIRKMHEFL